jgi:predicted Holliday junction resolvase-like endonuclease
MPAARRLAPPWTTSVPSASSYLTPPAKRSVISTSRRGAGTPLGDQAMRYAVANVRLRPYQQRKQNTMSEQLGFLFLVLFIVVAAVCIYLSITMSHRVQAGINRWRNEERQALEAEMKQRADDDARLQFERWKQEHEQQIRDDAIQRSLAITKGKVTEHIVPYLPGFDLDPKDIRFLGTPIDLIAFKGLDASVEEVEIVFIEVKTG